MMDWIYICAVAFLTGITASMGLGGGFCAGSLPDIVRGCSAAGSAGDEFNFLSSNRRGITHHPH